MRTNLEQTALFDLVSNPLLGILQFLHKVIQSLAATSFKNPFKLFHFGSGLIFFLSLQLCLCSILTIYDELNDVCNRSKNLNKTGNVMAMVTVVRRSGLPVTRAMPAIPRTMLLQPTVVCLSYPRPKSQQNFQVLYIFLFIQKPEV